MVISLLTGTRSQNIWTVFYPSSDICASEGSTVEISCYYSYPHLQHGLSVVDSLWFISEEDKLPVDLRTLSQFVGRVEYFCHNSKCSLIIRKLRESDSKVYKFRFITNMETGKYTGEPGVNLMVTGKTGVTITHKNVQKVYSSLQMQHQALGQNKTKVHCPCYMCESSKRRKHPGGWGCQ